ncbi:MAG: MFS transporter [Propionibacteriaceae bacterium]|jgi:MFS family permease|nr:MFS transporter [Propionibacteriaceae bacterium]
MRSYVELLRLPGALRFCAAALLARSGGAMMGIGQVLMVSALYGSYGLAGAVAAANGAAWAVGTAILSNLVDRLGQRRVMYPAAFVSAAALAVFIFLGLFQTPAWTLFPAAIVCGAFGGAPGAMVRARWNHTVENARQLHTAYSLESTLDELTFVVGPVFATLLSTSIHPAAGLAAPIVLSLSGAHLFYSQRATEPPSNPRTAAAAKPNQRRLAAWAGRLLLLAPGVGAVVAVNVLVGAFFGGVDVSAVAATTAWQARSSAGLVLGAFSLSSALAGFAYGARGWRSPLANRFLAGVLALLAGALTLPWAPSPVILALLGFAVGLTVAPTLINGNALIGRLVPPERLTEGLAWMGTSLGIGSALGSTTAGWAIDAGGARWGFLAAATAAILAAAIAVLGRSALRRALAARPSNLAGRGQRASAGQDQRSEPESASSTNSTS